MVLSFKCAGLFLGWFVLEFQRECGGVLEEESYTLFSIPSASLFPEV